MATDPAEAAAREINAAYCDDVHDGESAIAGTAAIISRHFAAQREELERQLDAATSCFGRWGKIEFNSLLARIESAEASKRELLEALRDHPTLTVHSNHHSRDYCDGYLTAAKEWKGWIDAVLAKAKEGR